MIVTVILLLLVTGEGESLCPFNIPINGRKQIRKYRVNSLTRFHSNVYPFRWHTASSKYLRTTACHSNNGLECDTHDNTSVETQIEYHRTDDTTSTAFFQNELIQTYQQPVNAITMLNSKLVGEIPFGREDSEASSKRRKLLFSLVLSLAGMNIPNYPSKAHAAVSTSEKATTVTDTVIAAPLDTRSYESFSLANGLRVLICSDPSSNTAAAAMNVHVGANSDPIEIPGMAHFNEHMLFLGTKPYPDEGSFETFLAANGGSSNAFTEGENTVYYFDMNAEMDDTLAQGLDRFGSFFSSPLFTESATGRELNAIDSENAKNLQNDAFRVYQIEKSRANRNHPYSKFYTGNKATLLEEPKRRQIDLRTELIKFWSTYYMADTMTLAVVAPQPTYIVRKMIEKTFSKIPNNPKREFKKPEEAWRGTPPFSTQPGSSIIPAQGYIVEIVPVADVRQVQILWPIVYKSPQDKVNQDLIKPAFFVSHLLGHEGQHSLLSFLKKQAWANAIGVSPDAEYSDFYTFGVTVELTLKGLDSVTAVIAAIFSYLQMITTDTIPRYIFDEVLQLSELSWRFLTKGEAESYAQSLVKGMDNFPPSLYIMGPRRLALAGVDSNEPRTSFTSEEQFLATSNAVTALVSQLSVDNALITLLSKRFEGPNNQIEKWYGTRYNVRPISSVAKKEWTIPERASLLGITFPPRNKFIPSETGLRVKIPVKNQNDRKSSFEERMKPISPPQIIRDDDRWTVYFKQDDRFGLPKAYFIAQLLTSAAYSDATRASLSQLFQLSTADRLSEYTYDATLADLSYDVQVLPRGIRLTFGGYNDKLLDFASYVCEKLSQGVESLLPSSEAEFERYKDTIGRALSAFDVQQPYAHASYFSSLTFQPSNFIYSNADLRSALKQTSLRDLRTYAKGIWDSGKAEALLQGNLERSEAMDFVQVVDRTLGFRTISPAQLPDRLRALPLPFIPVHDPVIKLCIAGSNPSDVNAASHLSIQSLGKSDKDHVLIEVLAAILNEPFYEDLRTVQQLGYIVSSGVKGIAETRNLAFVVQSSILPAEQLTEKIMVFLTFARRKYLEPLTDIDFARYVKGLILKRTEPDKKLATEATRNWNEIATGRLVFDRLQREVSSLLELTKSDVVRYWDELYVGSLGGRRVLVTEIVPVSGQASSSMPWKSRGYTNKKSGEPSVIPLVLGIDDIEEFRKRPFEDSATTL